jgi:Gluconate 2-dehydrogenase subunit 3
MSKPVSIVPIQSAPPWSARQRATLDALLELMIPASADGRMPAAVGLGLLDALGSISTESHAALATGLDQLESAASTRLGKPFAGLDAAPALQLVDALRPGAAPFFALLTLHVVSRYYEHPQVLAALGIDPSPPWPRGHEVDDGDWSLLDPVRGRQNLYRQA